MASDLFAPPTDDELAQHDMFAPPKPEEITPEAPSIPESIVRGGAQGLTAGWGNKISALGPALLEGITRMDPQTAVKTYIAYRDQGAKENAAAQQANPKSYLAGELAGGVAMPGVSGLAALKGGRALVGAAGLGATQGLGYSNADTIGGALKDTALGAGAGLAGHGLGTLAGRAIPTISGSANLAEKSAIEHLRPTPNVARVLGPDKLKDVARQALDTGQIGFGAKVGQTAENLGAQRQDIGSKIGDLLDSSDAQVNPRYIAKRIQDEVISPLKETAEGTGVAADIQDKVDRFLSKYAPDADANPSIGIGQLEAEKRAVQGNINYNTDPKVKTQAVRDYANVLKSSAEDAIDNPDFNSLKKQFSNTATGQQIADRSAALTDSGTGLMGHLYDLGAGNLAGGALLHGNPAGAAVLGGRALARGRTKSAIAVGADTASKFLDESPVFNWIANKADKYVPQGVEAYTRQNAPYTKQSATDPNTIMEKLQRSPQGQKYLPILSQAAASGKDGLATTSFILNQTDPEFQRAMQDDQGSESFSP